MFVTVKELLNIKTIKDIRLVGGEKGVLLKISGMNIMDNPDTLKWLQKGEFLLTTGYVFKDDLDLQGRIIQEMKAIGCSGLGIKVKRYFETIPAKMIQEANEYGLPLVEIPFDYTLSQVSNVFYKEMYNIQKAMLQKSLDIHKILTEVALEGGGLDRIAQVVAKMIGNPILILDASGHLMTYSEIENNLFPLNKYLHLKQGEKVFVTEFIEDLPKDSCAYKESLKKEYLLGGKLVSCRIKPISVSDSFLGYIIAWEVVRKMRQIDYVALEHGATIAALDRLKDKEIKEVKHSMRKDFFDDLLSGKIDSLEAVKSMCEIHGLDPTKRYGCIVLKLENYEELLGQELKMKGNEVLRLLRQLCGQAERICIQNHLSCISINRRNLLILFVQTPGDRDQKEIKAYLKDFAKLFYQGIADMYSTVSVSIGIGRIYPTILELGKSFREALEAISNGQNMRFEDKIAHFDDFLIYRLLAGNTKKEELQMFFENTIASLVQYDLENGTNLVDTLEAYFKHHGNISEAAKETYVHRNTFIYRMDKVKAVLKTELRDPEELLEIQLGLKAMKLIQLCSGN